MKILKKSSESWRTVPNWRWVTSEAREKEIPGPGSVLSPPPPTGSAGVFARARKGVGGRAGCGAGSRASSFSVLRSVVHTFCLPSLASPNPSVPSLSSPLVGGAGMSNGHEGDWGPTPPRCQAVDFLSISWSLAPGQGMLSTALQPPEKGGGVDFPWLTRIHNSHASDCIYVSFDPIGSLEYLNSLLMPWKHRFLIQNPKISAFIFFSITSR